MRPNPFTPASPIDRHRPRPTLEVHDDSVKDGEPTHRRLLPGAVAVLAAPIATAGAASPPGMPSSTAALARAWPLKERTS